MLTPVTTTSISPVCPACGIIRKSGKLSCCAHGGSWFGNCGNAENANFAHTWYDGIASCKARQFQVAVGEQLHDFQLKSNASSGDTSVGMHPKAIVVTAQVYASASANTSTPIPNTLQNFVTTNTSTITAARKSKAYDTRTTISKTIIATINTTIRAPVSMLTPKPGVLPANGTVMKPMMHSASADMSSTTLSHTPASASPAEQECNKLLRVAVCISMTLVTAC